MEKKEPPVIIETNGRTDIESEAVSPGNEVNGNPPAKKDVKTKGRKTKKNKTVKSDEKSSNSEPKIKKGIEPQIVITIITVIGTIITTIVVTLPNILPLIPWLQLSPTPTPTLAPTATLIFISDTPTPTSTYTPVSTLSPTVTQTSVAIVTSTSTETPTIIRVFVKLEANRNTGRPPLKVRFDARNSYLLEPDGKQLSCRGGPCFYTWSIFSGGQQIGKAENNSIGTFEYTFGQKGVYTVTVVVCRGRDKTDCAGSGTQVEVSR